MYEATVEDFSRVAGGGGGGGGGASNVFVARLQGLPYRVTEDEIVGCVLINPHTHTSMHSDKINTNTEIQSSHWPGSHAIFSTGGFL